jgi:hypothetical protein
MDGTYAYTVDWRIRRPWKGSGCQRGTVAVVWLEP